MKYNKLYFGELIDNHWNLLEVLDENKKATEFIAVRGEFWSQESEIKFNELIKTKKVIGLSSYQCFPKYINNPYENRGPKLEEESFINKYGNLVILWCHCFKDPQNYLPITIPRILYSETDQYPNIKYLNTIAKTNQEKKYDFFVSIQEGEWNSWIRGLDYAKKWLNYMADEMKLKILICGNGRSNDFSKNITFIDFQPWEKFINIMNTAKYLFCCSRYDASPRIIIEALSLNMPVLLNENILGGWKYINKKTGMLFFPYEDIKIKITNFIKHNNEKKFNPIKWLDLNFNIDNNAKYLAESINKVINQKYETYLDGILYINLKNRKDRFIQINNEFKKLDIPSNLIYRIDAVNNKTCGHLGCTMSHIKSLAFARKKKWKRFMILEDDFIFNYPKERLLYILSLFFKKIKKWDIIMLTTVWNNVEDTNFDFIKKINNATTTSGFIVNSDYIDTLYKNFFNSFSLLKNEVDVFKSNNPNKRLLETKNALDQKWFELQKKDNFYIIDPYIGKQSDSQSSIMKV